MKIDTLKKYVAIGYSIIVVLIAVIAYIYMRGWHQMDVLEDEAKHIHYLCQNVHKAYAQMLDLTMFGENILEWEEGDTAVYRRKRMKVDSQLCDFKNYYTGERLDSVRMLLTEKEIQLFSIARLFDEQSASNEEIAERVPVIAYESTQEPKRNCFYISVIGRLLFYHSSKVKRNNSQNNIIFAHNYKSDKTIHDISSEL